ncbi:hypothetical protein Gotri_018790, partial [Gossypium trilobum]|nr:hypothetical protein [Gossypium trilobum]
MGCGFRPRFSAQCSSETDCCNDSPPPPTPEFHWEREDRWHVITKVHDDDHTPQFNANLESIRETMPMRHGKRRKKNKKVKKSTRRNEMMMQEMSESPARLSSFSQWVVPCTVEGKVRESFAVVKKSEDPYKDFKRSMMEMILEKQLFEDEDLEQLLHCFLSLNSRHHHGTIVQAFAENWEALFSRRSTS